MKVRHGKLLTKKREQLVQDYKMRRAMWQGVTAGIPMRTLLEPREDYMNWVRGFERFMCRGLDERRVGPVRDLALARSVENAPAPMGRSDMENASRLHASSRQVD